MNIIELAKEAGYNQSAGIWNDAILERFAALVRAEALEEAAKVCDGLGKESGSDHEAGGMFECAAAIRGLK